eukprot:scaffold290399_cov33-Prasinocladus_malaysianus.AAC.1
MKKNEFFPSSPEGAHAAMAQCPSAEDNSKASNVSLCRSTPDERPEMHRPVSNRTRLVALAVNYLPSSRTKSRSRITSRPAQEPLFGISVNNSLDEMRDGNSNLRVSSNESRHKRDTSVHCFIRADGEKD